MNKKILVVCLLAFATHLCHAQDSTATINISWQGYANNTSLTYRQIITTCDSLFALAGYTDTMHNFVKSPMKHRAFSFLE